MATPLVPGAIIAVTVETTLNGQTMLNVLHYVLGTVGTADYIAALTALNTLLNGAGGLTDAMKACMSQDADFVSTMCQVVAPTRLVGVKAAVVKSGSVLATALPQNVSAVITKRTDQASRRGIGSFHLGAIASTQVDAGYLTGPLIGNLTTLGNVIRSTLAVGTQSYTPCLWSPITPAETRILVSTTVQQTSRVMRRRTVGVGI
jgi:hypothetical protein